MPYFGPHKLPATNSICHLQHFVCSLVQVFFLQQLNITFSERVLAVNDKQQILNLVTDKLESIAVRFGFFFYGKCLIMPTNMQEKEDLAVTSQMKQVPAFKIDNSEIVRVHSRVTRFELCQSHRIKNVF